MLRKINLDDNSSIEYVYFFKNNKRIYLRINKNSKIEVSAPLQASISDIDEFVKNNANWIKNKINISKNRNSILKGEDIDWIFHLGKKYPIIIKQSPYTNISLCEQALKMEVAIEIQKLDIQATVISWRRFTAKYIYEIILKRIYQNFSNIIDTCPKLKIRTTKSRWGSYSIRTNSIMINSELIKYPIECIEYVIAHELCHVKYLDHSKNFYKLLEEKLPDYKKRENILKNFPHNI